MREALRLGSSHHDWQWLICNISKGEFSYIILVEHLCRLAYGFQRSWDPSSLSLIRTAFTDPRAITPGPPELNLEEQPPILNHNAL